MAAMVVVLFHYSGYFGLPRLEFGYLAVDLFFVLSGIVLTRRYVLQDRRTSAAQFAWHRLRRLFPTVVLTAALLTGMSLAGVPDRASTPTTTLTILSVLFVTPYPAGHGYTAAFPNDPAEWSLWAELAGNAMWFAALRLGRGTAHALLGLSLAAFLAIVLAHGNFDVGTQVGTAQLLIAATRGLAGFALGYAIALRSPRPVAPTWLMAALLAATCCLCQASLVPGVVADILVVACGAGLLVNLMDLPTPGRAATAVCSALGKLSFPIYLTHLPAGRLATSLTASTGMDARWSHAIVVLLVGGLATLLNEQILIRLPSRLVLPRAI
jgi:peptidoglycan/LPS O-acetylase OafA/YrhL